MPSLWSLVALLFAHRILADARVGPSSFQTRRTENPLSLWSTGDVVR